MPNPAHFNTTEAIWAADAFRSNARRFWADLPSAAPELETFTDLSRIGEMIASATNLGLALELYLKTLRHLAGVAFARKHELDEIFMSLPDLQRDLVLEEYEKARAEAGDHVSEFILYKRAAGELTDGEADRSRPRSGETSLNSVLERSRDVFTPWRYLHEKGEMGVINAFVYENDLIDLACEAVRRVLLAQYEAHGLSLGVDEAGLARSLGPKRDV